MLLIDDNLDLPLKFLVLIKNVLHYQFIVTIEKLLFDSYLSIICILFYLKLSYIFICDNSVFARALANKGGTAFPTCLY